MPTVGTLDRPGERSTVTGRPLADDDSPLERQFDFRLVVCSSASVVMASSAVTWTTWDTRDIGLDYAVTANNEPAPPLALPGGGGAGSHAFTFHVFTTAQNFTVAVNTAFGTFSTDNRVSPATLFRGRGNWGAVPDSLASRRSR